MKRACFNKPKGLHSIGMRVPFVQNLINTLK